MVQQMGTVLLTLSINYKPWAFLCKTLVSCKQDVVQSWWTDCCIVDLRPHQSLDSCRGRGKGQPIRAESCWDDSNRNLWRAPISRRAVLLSLLSDRRLHIHHTHTHTHTNLVIMRTCVKTHKIYSLNRNALISVNVLNDIASCVCSSVVKYICLIEQLKYIHSFCAD